LVEGVISLVMITIGTVAAVTLLVNAGMTAYYKEKSVLSLTNALLMLPV